MDVVRVKRKKNILFFPHTFPHEVKGQYFEYFISGEGYKKQRLMKFSMKKFPNGGVVCHGWK